MGYLINYSRVETILHRISQWSFSIVLAIGAVSLVGWYSDLLIIASVQHRYVPIAPSTAFCFLIFSFLLLAYMLKRQSHIRQIIAMSGTVLIFSICFAILVSFFLGKKFSIEHPWIESPRNIGNIAAGYMSPVTSTLFLVATSGFICLLVSERLLSARKSNFKKIASYAATVVIGAGFTIILGYLQGSPLLYGGNIIPVSLPTAIEFELLGLGILSACGPYSPLIRIFVEPNVKSRLMRAFVPATIVITFIDGFLYHETFVTATNPALATSIIAFLSIMIVGFIVSKIASSVGNDIDREHAERDRIEEALKESSMKDALTGLYNRRFLQEYEESLVARVRRRDKLIGLIMSDLDFFKNVNDIYGHDIGDAVLKETAEILKNTVRASDIVVRFGGEEFLIVLMDLAEGEAIRIAEMTRKKIESAELRVNDSILKNTISLGISEFPSDTENFWESVKFADVALYEAKNSGRNKCVKFTKEMRKAG